jgi:hypothetical protein
LFGIRLRIQACQNCPPKKKNWKVSCFNLNSSLNCVLEASSRDETPFHELKKTCIYLRTTAFGNNIFNLKIIKDLGLDSVGSGSGIIKIPRS